MKLQFDQVGKRFTGLRGAVNALREVSLTVTDGEFFVVLGPSGCGKSTLLNLAAGLEQPTTGSIRFNDRVVADPAHGVFLGARRRNVAMVFQSYALYPHLSVFENIAFPLRIARMREQEIRRAAATAAESLGIDELLKRRPTELSGGQRQRVAIARAIVRRPELFLLDEPLSNLDAQLRSHTRVELKHLQRKLGVTTLYVTHDQTEAMTLGDRIGLFRDGRLVQTGTPGELYQAPQSAFAGSFIGSPPMNILPAALTEGAAGPVVRLAGIELPAPRPALGDLPAGAVRVGIRPEHIHICRNGQPGSMAGVIAAVESLGRENLVHVDTAGWRLGVLTTAKDPGVGAPVAIVIDHRRLHLFAAQEQGG